MSLKYEPSAAEVDTPASAGSEGDGGGWKVVCSAQGRVPQGGARGAGGGAGDGVEDAWRLRMPAGFSLLELLGR